jgi:dienelactone hydrolase
MLMKIFAILALVTLSDCGTSAAMKDSLWDWSTVALPADATSESRCQDVELRIGLERTKECLDQVKGPRPVVVFMHGCGGYNQSYVEFFRKLGYVVVAPNSMIRNREAACPTNLNVVALRTEEVQLMVERMAAWNWVDRSRLVLAGYSEGGVTTALYHQDHFRAKIIMGWTCRSASPLWAGISGRKPVLALVGSADHWYVNTPNEGHCGSEMKGLPSRSIVFEGVGHDVVADSRSHEPSRRAIREFLEVVLK